jgi:hypothetical protein
MTSLAGGSAVAVDFREADPDECGTCASDPAPGEAPRSAGLATTGALVMVGVPPGLAATTGPGHRLTRSPHEGVPVAPALVHADIGNRIDRAGWSVTAPAPGDGD